MMILQRIQSSLRDLGSAWSVESGMSLVVPSRMEEATEGPQEGQESCSRQSSEEVGGRQKQ